ncbi:unnamed protein product [Trifolium pratense]|uniref:Uncharacterized protein n=1 Tax=Trifolium pratense TaxID=57577 RepID=A0ACB0KNG6_TRIPR|nr:unnamed protein product [Trifolium pratense]
MEQIQNLQNNCRFLTFQCLFTYSASASFNQASDSFFAKIRSNIQLLLQIRPTALFIHSNFKIQVLNTSKGSIIVELYKESAPEAVDEFIDLWYLDDIEKRWNRRGRANDELI